MDRPTVNLLLPDSKATVILYSFLTNGEDRKLQRKIMELTGIEFEQEEGKSKLKLNDLKGSTALDIEDFALTLIIAGINREDGTSVATEEIPAFVDNISQEDGKLLYAKVNELTKSSSLSEEAKKK